MSAERLTRDLVLAHEGVCATREVYLRYLASTWERYQRSGDPVVVAAVRRALGRDVPRTLACFASPTVGSAIHCAELASALPDCAPRIAASVAALGPHLLLELALRGLVGEDGVSFAARSLTVPSLNVRLTFAAPCTLFDRRLEVGGESMTLDEAGLAAPPACVHVEQTHHDVAGLTRLGLVDHNPISSFEAHPDKPGNALDLGERPVHEWLERLERAFAIITAHLPEIVPEMKLLLHEILPVGYHGERHLSASYREAIGTVYVTLHPDELTLAEALVHEFQHNKVNALSHLGPLLDNAFSPLFPSPIRPDPRPLWGILLAAHAFLPVAVMYRRMRAASHPRAVGPEFARRLGEIDLKNHEAVGMLEIHGRFTPPGSALMHDLSALDRAHMAERREQGLPTETTSCHIG